MIDSPIPWNNPTPAASHFEAMNIVALNQGISRPEHELPDAARALRSGRARRMLLIALLALPSGCAVPVHQQRLVSKPSMQFSDSPVFNYQSRLLAQVEPGAAASGGAQAAGCTSCR